MKYVTSPAIHNNMVMHVELWKTTLVVSEDAHTICELWINKEESQLFVGELSRRKFLVYKIDYSCA